MNCCLPSTHFDTFFGSNIPLPFPFFIWCLGRHVTDEIMTVGGSALMCTSQHLRGSSLSPDSKYKNTFQEQLCGHESPPQMVTHHSHPNSSKLTDYSKLIFHKLINSGYLSSKASQGSLFHSTMVCTPQPLVSRYLKSKPH